MEHKYLFLIIGVFGFLVAFLSMSSLGQDLELSTVVIAGQPPIDMIFVDEGSLVWTGCEDKECAIYCCIKPSCNPKRLTSISKEAGIPGSMLIHGNFVYWIETDTGMIRKVPKQGGKPIDVAVGQSVSGQMPWSLVVSGTNVYWTVRSSLPGGADGFIRQNGENANTSQDIASGQADPIGIATDGSTLYWTVCGTMKKDFRDGAIMAKRLINGSKIRAVASNLENPTKLHYAGGFLFAVEGPSGQSLIKIDPMRGTILRILDDMPLPTKVYLTSDSRNVYVVNDIEVRLIPIRGGKPMKISWERGTSVFDFWFAKGPFASDGQYMYWAESENGKFKIVRRSTKLLD